MRVLSNFKNIHFIYFPYQISKFNELYTFYIGGYLYSGVKAVLKESYKGPRIDLNLIRNLVAIAIFPSHLMQLGIVNTCIIIQYITAVYKNI